MGVFAPFSFLEKDVVPAGFDPDAEAFFTAAGITDATQKDAVNNLVLDLKADNLWTKMIAVYPFVGGTATTHKYNLVDPQDTDAAYRLTFVGGITHNSDGITSNGSTGYANTHINASTDLSQNDNHMMGYEKVTTAGGASNGAYDGVDWFFFNSRRSSDNTFQSRNMSTTSNTVAISHSVTQGAFTITRNSSTAFTGAVQKTKGTDTSATSGAINLDVYIGGALNSSGTSAFHKVATSQLYTFGTGLSDTDIDNLSDIGDDYQTALSR